jgi:hypothetical protein
MTTREEMALGFALKNLDRSANMLAARARTGHVTSDNDLEKHLENVIKGAVEMADLLITELSKGQPPIKPQVNLKDREACG